MKNLKPFPLIRQAGMMECGTTCLAMIFKYYGYYDIRRFLSEQAEVNLEGTDLYTLSQLAQKFGFDSDGYQMSYDDMLIVKLPLIAHYDGNHFVVVYRVTKDKIWIADPARGKYAFTRKEFEEKWNGIALILNPTPEIFKHSELTELVEATREKERSLFKKYYWPSITQSQRNLMGILIGSLLIIILELALPVLTQTIIDNVLVSENIKLLYGILAGFILVFAARILLIHGRNLLLFQFRIDFELSLFSKLFLHFLKLRQQYFDNHKKEEFINRFQENLKIRQSLSPFVQESILNFIFSLILMGVLIYYNLVLGLISIFFLVIFIIGSILTTPIQFNLREKSFREGLKPMGIFLDTLLGIQTTRLLGIEQMKYHKWRNQYVKSLNMELETAKTYVNYATIFTGLWNAGQVLVYWYGAYLTFQGTLTIGSYVAFITIFTRIMGYAASIINLQNQLIDLSVSYKKLNDILAQPEFSDERAQATLPSGPIGFQIQNLTFKYSRNSVNNTLNDISIEVKPGSFTGIVGRNGSGKSTLVKLLCRIYPDYDGKILLNGKDLLTIQEHSLKKRISVIPQDVFIFDGTIRENILYGNLSATDGDILRAIEQADFIDYVRSQYLGLNTRIGDNGIKLSGGEQLKLAFARLFVSNPELIILDEASSALDVETEHKIMNNIKTHFKGKTIISVAHRLYTLKEADSILVMEKGKVVESGSHEELIVAKGLYYNFINTYLTF